MAINASVSEPDRGPRGSATEVWLAFTKLGLTSFGGPIAHIGYFREEFVVRRGWLEEHAFADLVALFQFLPGPTSSQVGFSIGLKRAGYLGGLAAWLAFTLPSAIALVLFAYGAGAFAGTIGTGLLHGLKLVAVAIVAQAVWGMARTLCPDPQRASIALVAAIVVLSATSALAQVAAMLIGALGGLLLCRGAVRSFNAPLSAPISRSAGMVALALFAGLLAGLPIATALVQSRTLDLFDAFYRSGALVFGGGHVVLPLLREAVVTPGWIDDSAFLAGYGATQAVPGPLFTFAAYLGAMIDPASRLAGATLALVAIFLPGILLVLGTLPFWGLLRNRARAQAAMHGVNAAVVGLLGAALYDPVWTSAVRTRGDFALALIGFVLLVAWRLPPLAVVIIGAVAGIVWQA